MPELSKLFTIQNLAAIALKTQSSACSQNYQDLIFLIISTFSQPYGIPKFTQLMKG